MATTRIVEAEALERHPRGERRLRRQALFQGLQGGIAGHGADAAALERFSLR